MSCRVPVENWTSWKVRCWGFVWSLSFCVFAVQEQIFHSRAAAARSLLSWHPKGGDIPSRPSVHCCHMREGHGIKASSSLASPNLWHVWVEAQLEHYYIAIAWLIWMTFPGRISSTCQKEIDKKISNILQNSALDESPLSKHAAEHLENVILFPLLHTFVNTSVSLCSFNVPLYPRWLHSFSPVNHLPSWVKADFCKK